MKVIYRTSRLRFPSFFFSCSFISLLVSPISTFLRLLASYPSTALSILLSRGAQRLHKMDGPQSSEADARDTFTVDVEQKAIDESSLRNDTVRNFSWQGVSVTVKDRGTKEPKAILDNVEGYVEAGEIEFYIQRSLLVSARDTFEISIDR